MSLEAELKPTCGSDTPTNLTRPNLTRSDVKSILGVIASETKRVKNVIYPKIVAYMAAVEPSATQLEDYHVTWATIGMDWLYPEGKELEKTYLAPIPDDVRSKYASAASHFQLDVITSMLKDCAHRFQLLLIGLCHMLELHAANEPHDFAHGPLKSNVSFIKYTIKQILCDVRLALHRFGAKYEVTNSTIPYSKKENNETQFYEWIIFREYLNQLEHLNEIVVTINANIDASRSS